MVNHYILFPLDSRVWTCIIGGDTHFTFYFIFKLAITGIYQAVALISNFVKSFFIVIKTFIRSTKFNDATKP